MAAAVTTTTSGFPRRGGRSHSHDGRSLGDNDKNPFFFFSLLFLSFFTFLLSFKRLSPAPVYTFIIENIFTRAQICSKPPRPID